MSNSYYNHSTYPAPNSPGSSAQLRSELELITTGFNKLPTISLGNAHKVAVVNSGGTALVASSSLQGLSITGSSLNNTPIGGTTASTGSFTNLTVSGISLLGNSVTIGGGTINATLIGGATPAAGYFTTLAASNGITGNLTGNVTGNLTGNVSGNVTASTGSSSFNNVTINGQLDMNGGTTATIVNLSAPVNAADAATKSYVDTSIANLIDSSPATLDTLNEIAAALGDDPNFATTMTNSLAGKLSLTGGAMTGPIAMGSNKITGLADPTANQDAVTKLYADQTFLKLAGGTMAGPVAMGNNKVTGLATPTAGQDGANKAYVDSILGSATSAATSAAAAAASEANALTSKNAAYASQIAAAANETNTAAIYDSFDDRYLGAKNADPSTDNDGNQLMIGALYWNAPAKMMKVWGGDSWVTAYLPATGYLQLGGGTMTGPIVFAAAQTFPADKVNGLSAVATSGSYADLSNKPTLFSGAYADLTGKPTLFSGAYADLTGKPALFSGAYADLTGKPALFSGAYADLTGKPSFAAVAVTGSYADLTNKPTIDSLLPNQSGKATKFLSTDGTASVWADVPKSFSSGKAYFFAGF